jgi:hypothetical protein
LATTDFVTPFQFIVRQTPVSKFPRTLHQNQANTDSVANWNRNNSNHRMHDMSALEIRNLAARVIEFDSLN